MTVGWYRKYIPASFREKIYEVFLGDTLLFFRNFSKIIKTKSIYYLRFFLPDTEINRLYTFVGRNRSLLSIPYQYIFEYDEKIIDCFYDESKKLPYVIHKRKKLFFPDSMKEKAVISYYRYLLIEQLLSSLEYQSEFTEGYLYYNNEMRKAIIRKSLLDSETETKKKNGCRKNH